MSQLPSNIKEEEQEEAGDKKDREEEKDNKEDEADSWEHWKLQEVRVAVIHGSTHKLPFYLTEQEVCCWTSGRGGARLQTVSSNLDESTNQKQQYLL